MKRIISSIALIFICAVSVRLLGLSGTSFTMDEYVDLIALRRGDPEEFFVHSSELVRGIVSHLLTSESLTEVAAARLPNAVLGALSALVVAVIGFCIGGRREGFFAGLILALCPFHIAASRLYGTHGHLEQSFYVLCSYAFLLLAYRCRGLSAIATSALAGSCAALAVSVDTLALVTLTPLCLAYFFSVLFRQGLRSQIIVVGCAGLLTLLACQPTFVTEPLATYAKFSNQYSFWETLRGYMWLGKVVDSLPPLYFGVVLLTKVPPPMLLLALIGLVRMVIRQDNRMHRWAMVVLIGTLPLLHFKPWKSPFYLTAYLPFIALLGAHGLEQLFERVKDSVRWVRFYAPGLIVGGSLAMLVPVYPDYLLVGAPYSEKLLGEFQGPLVSHGQWVGPAVQAVAARQPDATLWYPHNVAGDLFRYYGGMYQLTTFEFDLEKDPASQFSPGDWIVLSRDVAEVCAPLNPGAVATNAPFVDWVRTSGGAQLRVVLGPPVLPMMWIYQVPF